MSTDPDGEQIEEWPPWDGGADRVLPEPAITDHLQLLEDLMDVHLPGGSGDDIADALKDGAIMQIAAGEVSYDSESEIGIVVLYLPFFEDQRIWVWPEADLPHEEISVHRRWRCTEGAMTALLEGLPAESVELGFVVGGRGFTRPWFEYCAHYDLPPQYVVAAW